VPARTQSQELHIPQIRATVRPWKADISRPSTADAHNIGNYS
jgi:hypothetical protein